MFQSCTCKSESIESVFEHSVISQKRNNGGPYPEVCESRRDLKERGLAPPPCMLSITCITCIYLISR